MKKSLTAFFMALTAIFASCFFAACNYNTVKYNLVDIDFANITVSHYEYNYIKFDFDNNTYILKNKVKSNGIVSSQKGRFLVDADNYVTITNDNVPTQDYLLCANEIIYFEDDELIIEGSIVGYGNVSMIFRK